MEMTKKSMVQVVIGGKVLTMGGYDDETHIQRIASCVNRVMRQMEDADEYRCLPADLKPIFIHINIVLIFLPTFFINSIPSRHLSK